jgi:predicted component of type VI protein secretion system
MKISLMVLSTGKAAGKALPINTAQFIIGRDPQCNLRPASAMISKRHCALLVKSGEVFVRDFESTNGTYVNDEPIKGEVALKHGDVLRVGPLTFMAVIESEPPPLPKTIPSTDAAALLSVDRVTGAETVSTAETGEEAIPGGTTVLEGPLIPPVEDDTPDTVVQAPSPPNPDDKKPAAKKPAAGAAQDAAKAILEKLRQGKRK